MKERCGYIDVVKALTIYLVVLGHVIQFWQYQDCWWTDRVFLLIYSFHMPLFMMVSGLVVGMYRKTTPYLLFIRKRFVQLIVPYLSWAFIDVLRKDNLDCCMIFTYPNNFLWFLWALFFISIMVEACLNINKAYIRCFRYIILLIVMLVLKKIFGSMFAIDKISLYLIFYILGVELGKRKYKESLIKKAAWLFPIWFLMAFIYKWGGNMHNVILNQLFIYIMPLSGCLTFISLVFNLKKMLEKRFVLKIGTVTLGIYAIHYILIDIFCLLIRLNHNILLCLVGSIIIVVLCLFLIEIIHKNKILSFLLLGIHKYEKR